MYEFQVLHFALHSIAYFCIFFLEHNSISRCNYGNIVVFQTINLGYIGAERLVLGVEQRNIGKTLSII